MDIYTGKSFSKFLVYWNQFIVKKCCFCMFLFWKDKQSVQMFMKNWISLSDNYLAPDFKGCDLILLSFCKFSFLWIVKHKQKKITQKWKFSKTDQNKTFFIHVGIPYLLFSDFVFPIIFYFFFQKWQIHRANLSGKQTNWDVFF